MSSSTVTYTSVYTDSEPGRVFWGANEELSDGGSPRVIVYRYDGLLMQPVAPPSPDYVSGPEHPPSPDYVPGPKHLPSPVEVPYVPELEYPEYLVPSDAEAPLEDQSLPTDASPTTLSPGYVVDSDPDEDLEEDPKEDHTDYPANGGDGDDVPFDDDDDNDDTNDEDEDPFEDEDDDEEEEEHWNGYSKRKPKTTKPSTEWKRQSHIKAKVSQSTLTKSKVNQMKKIQLEGLKLPNLKLYYKKTRAEIEFCYEGIT
ncbi:hypothetical protein Tco_0986520 [Tanacetum coccineum]